jgi:uncharacterized membrane protein
MLQWCTSDFLVRIVNVVLCQFKVCFWMIYSGFQMTHFFGRRHWLFFVRELCSITAASLTLPHAL